MRITVVYGASLSEVTVSRSLDGRRNQLIISCGWKQDPAEVFRLARPSLTDEEAAELADVFGIAHERGQT